MPPLSSVICFQVRPFSRLTSRIFSVSCSRRMFFHSLALMADEAMAARRRRLRSGWQRAWALSGKRQLTPRERAGMRFVRCTPAPTDAEQPPAVWPLELPSTGANQPLLALAEPRDKPGAAVARPCLIFAGNVFFAFTPGCLGAGRTA